MSVRWHFPDPSAHTRTLPSLSKCVRASGCGWDSGKSHGEGGGGEGRGEAAEGAAWGAGHAK